MHPPADAHLTEEDAAEVEVPADGLCLYHCAVAARDRMDIPGTRTSSMSRQLSAGR